jgi:hypothetical protein
MVLTPPPLLPCRCSELLSASEPAADWIWQPTFPCAVHFWGYVACCPLHQIPLVAVLPPVVVVLPILLFSISAPP